MKNLKRIKDIHDITAENARYIIRRVCHEFGMKVPTDAEIELDGCTTWTIETSSMYEWVRIEISAEVRGVLYRFGVDVTQAINGRATLCCNPDRTIVL